MDADDAEDQLVSFQGRQEGSFLENGYSELDSSPEGREVEEMMAQWSVARTGGVSKLDMDELIKMAIDPNEVYNNNSSSRSNVNNSSSTINNSGSTINNSSSTINSSSSTINSSSSTINSSSSTINSSSSNINNSSSTINNSGNTINSGSTINNSGNTINSSSSTINSSSSNINNSSSTINNSSSTINNSSSTINNSSSNINNSSSNINNSSSNINNNNNNSSVAETASETDSGISDDQRPDSPLPARPPTPTRLYQLVYGVSLKAEGVGTNADLVSIELGGWSSPVALLPDARALETAPGGCGRGPGNTGGAAGPSSLMRFPDLHLTNEERRLLNQEGIEFPSDLPLTKAEERILKKVRRKIRNKQSAQESRRRKKVYIDGLENRVTACTAQNHELQKQVEQLEHHNLSLIAQLRRLQTLTKHTSNKAAQTTTCIMILACSLVLLIFPSYSPFRLETPVNQQGYKPTGVMSRTILTEVGSVRGRDPDEGVTQEEEEAEEGGQGDPGPPPDPHPPAGAQRGSRPPPGLANATSDPTKPGHADEM